MRPRHRPERGGPWTRRRIAQHPEI